jgi:hypothetical protein
VSALLVQEGRIATARRALPVVLLGVGFLLSATTVFLAVRLVGGVSGAGNAGAAAHPAIAAALCAVFFAVDVWVLARGRQFSIGLPRQTPKMITYRRGAMLGAFVWGLDTGTAVSTFRVSATTWAALGLTVLGIAPPLTGLAYGVGFAVPLAVAVLVPRWRPDDDDGTRYEPRWIPRMLQLHVRTVQLAGLVTLAGSGAVLLTAALW